MLAFTSAFRFPPAARRYVRCARMEWSQVGHFGLKTLGTVLPKSVLKLDVFYKLRLGGLQAPFWRLQGSILEGLEMIF